MALRGPSARGVLAKKRPLLDRMKANPAADWTMNDVRTLCRRHGLTCEAPGSGSHYKVYGPHLAGTLTIPWNRPIKSVYIENLVSYTEAHLRHVRQTDEPDGL